MSSWHLMLGTRQCLCQTAMTEPYSAEGAGLRDHQSQLTQPVDCCLPSSSVTYSQATQNTLDEESACHI